MSSFLIIKRSSSILTFWLLYLVTFIVVYLLPGFAKYPYFLAMMVLIVISKRDFWWIAFFFVLFAQIGGLFPAVARVEGVTARLPVYRLGLFRLPVYQLFVLTFLAKSLLSKIKFRSFKRPLWLMAIYVVILYVYSIVVGMSASSHLYTIIALIGYSLFYSIPRLMKTRYDVYAFSNLIFSAMFIVVFFQFIELITGFKIGNVKGVVYTKFTIESNEIRLIYASLLNFLSYVLASFYLYKKGTTPWSRGFLGTVIVLCLISIFLSATRGWFLAYVIMQIIFLFVFTSKTHKVIGYIAPIVGVFIFALISSAQMKYVFSNVFTRLQTIELVAGGDTSAGGTLQRIDTRLPRVMNKAAENPFIGFGFSDEYYAYADSHVGPALQLLQMGIVGILLFLFFFMIYTSKALNAIVMSGDKAYSVFIVALIGLLVIHSTSTAVFAFSALSMNSPQLLAILLASSDIIMEEGIAKLD